MGNNLGWGNSPQMQQTSGNSMVVFINDDAEAMNYPIGPGYTVALVNANDQNNGKLFIRSSESNGMPKPARIFSIKEITPKPKDADSVSREEFETLTQEIGNLSSQFRQVLASLQQVAPAQPATAPTHAPANKGGKKA